MNHSLQEKILKMDMEQLNKIIENPELYSPEAIELAKHSGYKCFLDLNKRG